MAALRAHLEAKDLEGSVKGWPPAARQLVFPNTVGRITRYGGFLELVWQPLVAAAKLPYRKPHAMRHSYATWMLEAGADLRWVKDQLGHASIEETEGTYGRLERERHERRVDLDAVLGIGSGASPGVHASDAGAEIEGQLPDFAHEDLVVEGKGFVTPDPPSISDLTTPPLPHAAPSGTPRPPASTAPDPTPAPDSPPSGAPPAESREQKQEENRDLLITDGSPTEQHQDDLSARKHEEAP